MGFFSSSSSSSKEGNNANSGKLAEQAVNDLNCQQHMEKYRSCMMENMNTSKKPQCIKLLDEFRFCLVYREQKQSSNQGKTVLSNEYLQKHNKQ